MALLEQSFAEAVDAGAASGSAFDRWSGVVTVAPAFVTAAQDGAVIATQVGEGLVIELAENPATGYRWAFDGLDENRIVVEDSAYRPDPQLDGGGIAAWTLHARVPGRTRVALKRWRSWEGSPSIIERFSIVILAT